MRLAKSLDGFAALAITGLAGVVDDGFQVQEVHNAQGPARSRPLSIGIAMRREASSAAVTLQAAALTSLCPGETDAMVFSTCEAIW